MPSLESDWLNHVSCDLVCVGRPEGLCMLRPKCSEIRTLRVPKFDFYLYSSTELADIGAVLLEYRRLSVDLPRSGAGLQAPVDTSDLESDFSKRKEPNRNTSDAIRKKHTEALSDGRAVVPLSGPTISLFIRVSSRRMQLFTNCLISISDSSVFNPSSLTNVF